MTRTMSFLKHKAMLWEMEKLFQKHSITGDDALMVAAWFMLTRTVHLNCRGSIPEQPAVLQAALIEAAAEWAATFQEWSQSGMQQMGGRS